MLSQCQMDFTSLNGMCAMDSENLIIVYALIKFTQSSNIIKIVESALTVIIFQNNFGSI